MSHFFSTKDDGLIFIEECLLNYFYDKSKIFLKSNQLPEKQKNSVRNLIKEFKNYNFILIDFSNSYFKRGKANLELISRKMMKYLDFSDSFLILISLNWDWPELIKKLPISINYKKRFISTKKVSLINPFLLFKIMGFDNKLTNYLKKIVNSIKLEDLDKLKNITEQIENYEDYKIYSTNYFLKNYRNYTLEKWVSEK